MINIDWTKISDDPNNKESYALVHDWLLGARKIHDDIDLMGFIEQQTYNKKVLDIGIAEHSLDYIERSTWKHGKICASAKSCLGIDILEPLVDELNTRGFNVKCVDATSDIDLNEKFEVIYIGDVIEHVNNPIALLSFAARHLTTDGKIFVSTPNVFSKKFFRRFKKANGAVVVNLDHVLWITPTQALEIARRAGVKLAAYHLIKKMSPVRKKIKKIVWKLEPPEYTFPNYLYEFVL